MIKGGRDELEPDESQGLARGEESGVLQVEYSQNMVVSVSNCNRSNFYQPPQLRSKHSTVSETSEACATSSVVVSFGYRPHTDSEAISLPAVGIVTF